jgi:DMSO reductase anchor subunit
MKIFRELSYWWAAAIGLLFPILQALIYYIRFGILNPYAPLIDYILFFLAGTLGGLILIALLRRSETKSAKWSVSLAYLLGTPVAFLGSLGGGLFGPVGVILLPTIIWAVFSLIGYWLGSLFSKDKSKESES